VSVNNNFTGNVADGFTLFWHSTSPYSQWHPSVFHIKGITFTSAEQFMMYCKAKFFNDHTTAMRIVSINHQDNVLNWFLIGRVNREDIFSNRDLHQQWDGFQKKIKAMGRSVKPYIEKDWAENRVKFVKRGSLEKYAQNNDLKNLLLNTGKTRLVECNPYDLVWSCGLRPENPLAKNPEHWIGLDLLGKTLTEIKKGFQAETQ
jgi:predicted NAD-dependent protein-ADP-ribosyltransferase YbiA (DUF1768 family)